MKSIKKRVEKRDQYCHIFLRGVSTPLYNCSSDAAVWCFQMALCCAFTDRLEEENVDTCGVFVFDLVVKDPDEDEETRLYRLKIEEQKRLREEILRKKEMRRQMQAGVRKKELLDRITSQGANQGPGQGPFSNQNAAAPYPPQQQQQQQQQQLPQQQQRQQAPFPPKPQQPLVSPQQGSPFPPNGTPQTAQSRQNVKTRLQMAKGGPPPQQQQQRPGPGGNQQDQWQQQRRNAPLQNPVRPGPQFQSPQAPPGNMPLLEGQIGRAHV